MSVDDRRHQWDERHRGGDFEGSGPNPSLALAVGRGPGDALELGAGSGTNAVWLARQGWTVTAVDWSPVGLANGRVQASAAGVEVQWLEHDLFTWTPPERAYDLVTLVYLQLVPAERRLVYDAAARAVAPGGRLVVVAHDPLNLAEGEGGPPDPDRLFTAAALADDLLAADPSLVVERAEVVRQVAPPGRGPIDALLVIRRPAG